ncbi:hypothetical protein ILYODFUR_010999 [Ilyodon furcidens]|uniref:Uncharacterized protein n=1 Tax=Ilyodon furcidens TaxID=33524 RepID=A0ABV0UHA4_9TELE
MTKTKWRKKVAKTEPNRGTQPAGEGEERSVERYFRFRYHSANKQVFPADQCVVPSAFSTSLECEQLWYLLQSEAREEIAAHQRFIVYNLVNFLLIVIYYCFYYLFILTNITLLEVHL